MANQSVLRLHPQANHPTNIASVHLLVVGCSNATAGVKVAKKKTLDQPRATQPLVNYH